MYSKESGREVTQQEIRERNTWKLYRVNKFLDALVIFEQDKDLYGQARCLQALTRYNESEQCFLQLLANKDVPNTPNEAQLDGILRGINNPGYYKIRKSLKGLVCLYIEMYEINLAFLVFSKLLYTKDFNFQETNKSLRKGGESLKKFLLLRESAESEVWLGLARCYQNSNRYYDALQAYAKLLSSDNKSFESISSALLVGEGKLSEQLKQISIPLDLAHQYQIMHRHHDALRVFAKLLTKSPNEYDAACSALLEGKDKLFIFLQSLHTKETLLDLARQYQIMLRHDDALCVFAKLLSENCVEFNNACNALLAQEEQLKEFLKQIKNNSILLDLARHYQVMGQSHASLQVIAKIFSQNSNDFESTYRALLEGNNQLQNVLQTSQKNPAMITLARYYEDIQQNDNALIVYSRLLWHENIEFESVIKALFFGGKLLQNHLSLLKSNEYLTALARHYEHIGRQQDSLWVFAKLYNQKPNDFELNYEQLIEGGERLKNFLQGLTTQVTLMGIGCHYEHTKRYQDALLVFAKSLCHRNMQFNDVVQKIFSGGKHLVDLLNRIPEEQFKKLLKIIPLYQKLRRDKEALLCCGRLLSMNIINSQEISSEKVYQVLEVKIMTLPLEYAYTIAECLCRIMHTSMPYSIIIKQWPSDLKAQYRWLNLNYQYHTMPAKEIIETFQRLIQEYPYIKPTSKANILELAPPTSKLLSTLSQLFVNYDFYLLGGCVATLIREGIEGLCDIDIMVNTDNQEQFVKQLQCTPALYMNNLVYLPRKQSDNIANSINRLGIKIDIILFHSTQMLKPDFKHCALLAKPDGTIIELVQGALHCAQNGLLDTVETPKVTFSTDPTSLLRAAHYVVHHNYKLHGQLNVKEMQECAIYLQDLAWPLLSNKLKQYTQQDGKQFWKVLNQWGILGVLLFGENKVIDETIFSKLPDYTNHLDPLEILARLWQQLPEQEKKALPNFVIQANIEIAWKEILNTVNQSVTQPLQQGESSDTPPTDSKKKRKRKKGNKDKQKLLETETTTTKPIVAAVSKHEELKTTKAINSPFWKQPCSVMKIATAVALATTLASISYSL